MFDKISILSYSFCLESVRGMNLSRHQGGSMVDLVAGFLTLVLLETILGIDNVIMVAIQVGELPREQQARARVIGMGGALLMRVGLLLCMSWLIGLVKPLFHLFSHGFSVRDLIMIGGGGFLVWIAATKIHHKVEGVLEAESQTHKTGFAQVILQIMFVDLVFSLDSVITAIGMANDIRVMIAAVVVSMLIMIAFAKPIGDFIIKHVSLQILALAFLFLLGAFLMADGMGKHIEKGYIYTPMAFAFGIELLHLRRRSIAAKRAALVRGKSSHMDS